MPTLKGIAITTGLIAGTGGIAGGIAYATGTFDSKTQKIDELIKKENKHVLLTSKSTADEWKAAWNLYKASNKAWGDFVVSRDTVPEDFKGKCTEQSKGSVYGINDQNYKDITKYCGRDKTIADLLGEQSFGLLDTKKEEETWKARFDEYKKETNNLKLKGVDIGPNENKEQHHGKLSKGCEVAVKVKTASAEYDKNIPAIKEWCKAKG